MLERSFCADTSQFEIWPRFFLKYRNMTMIMMQLAIAVSVGHAAVKPTFRMVSQARTRGRRRKGWPRVEMRVAVEEWLRRIPEFYLDPARPMTWSQGTVRGPRLLPIVLG